MNNTLKTRLKVYDKSIKRNKKINLYESVKNLDEHTFGIPKRVLIPKKDGGEREVFVYNSSDSLLLKMLSEEICENHNKDLYKHLYSYKEGIGCVDAVKYVMKSAKGMYGYKLDITNYFMNVPIGIIEKNLKLIFQDDKELSNILKFYKDNRYYDVDGSLKHRFLSLKPGNPLSAFLSNFVLNDLDKLMDSISDVYVRYSDDILIFCKEMDKLDNTKSVLIDELNKIGLEIKESKTEFIEPLKPLNYLGLKIDWKDIDLSDNRFLKLKRDIKHQSKLLRNELNYQKINKEEAVLNFINWYNRKLYGKPFKLKEPYSWATNLYKDITTIKTLKEIDFYFINTLRQLYTGKNNSSNIKKLPLEIIKAKGWVSCVYMYKMFRKNQNLFNDYTEILISKGNVSIYDK